MSIVPLFDLLVFIAQKGIFVLEYRKRRFPGPFCLKKELEKWPFWYQNHGLTSLEKSQFFVFLNFFFYSLEWRFFCFRISQNTFSWPILEKKEEVVKKAIFVQKAWITPFRKMPILRLFELLIFIAQKGVFSFQNVVKDISPCLFRLKKRSWTNGHFQTKSLG